MFKFCFIASFLLMTGCSSSLIESNQNKPYNRAQICEETSRQLAFYNPDNHRHKKMTKKQYDQIVDTYILNGCDK